MNLDISLFGGIIVVLITLFVVPVYYSSVAVLQLKIKNKTTCVVKTQK
jgi:hypothetical protein